MYVDSLALLEHEHLASRINGARDEMQMMSAEMHVMHVMSASGSNMAIAAGKRGGVVTSAACRS